MKVPMGVLLKTVRDEPLRDQDKKEMTLGDAMIGALFAVSNADDGKTKFEKYKLAKKIIAAGAGDVHLTINEVAKIHELIGAVYPTAVVGPAWELLDAPPAGSEREDQQCPAI